jgi:FKBP-type peptidyl-prolyl cis-trans isomerase SlyD
MTARVAPDQKPPAEGIGRDTFVRLDYHLETDRAELAHQPGEYRELAFITGQDQVLPAVERALLGHRAGQDLSFTLEPDEGYGPHRPVLVQFVGRDYLAEDYEYQPGQRLKHRLGGLEVAYTVREVRPEGIMVDFNHLLAGRRLHFQIRIREVRPATAAELSSVRQDHPAGPGEDRHGQPDQA